MTPTRARLVGGRLDGQVVRLDGEPPEVLTREVPRIELCARMGGRASRKTIAMRYRRTDRAVDGAIIYVFIF